MSEKDCGHHGRKKQKLLRIILIVFLVLVILVLLAVLITWAILQPKKPQFTLQDATVFAFNLSAPNILSSVLQLTVIARNPNSHISIYYDDLDTYVVYRDQQITYPTSVPSGYQTTHATFIWSPFVYGQYVPIAPVIGAMLAGDEQLGTVPLEVKMDGSVRWKVGAFTSGEYRIHVSCPALIRFGTPAAGVAVANNGIKYQLGYACGVSV